MRALQLRGAPRPSVREETDFSPRTRNRGDSLVQQRECVRPLGDRCKTIKSRRGIRTAIRACDTGICFSASRLSSRLKPIKFCWDVDPLKYFVWRHTHFSARETSDPRLANILSHQALRPCAGSRDRASTLDPKFCPTICRECLLRRRRQRHWCMSVIQIIQPPH